jgi:hypothetical protein
VSRPAIDPEDFREALEIMSKGVNAPPALLAKMAISHRKLLAGELRRYGEDSVASAIEAAADRAVLSVAPRGIQIAFSGGSIPRSLCLAAVEVIEGKSRPFARTRRKRAT